MKHWLLVNIENVVSEGRFGYIWGPFDDRSAIENWLVVRLVEEYVITPSILIQDEQPNMPEMPVREITDLDCGDECLLYDEDVWKLTRDQFNCDILN